MTLAWIISLHAERYITFVVKNEYYNLGLSKQYYARSKPTDTKPTASFNTPPEHCIYSVIPIIIFTIQIKTDTESRESTA